MESVGLTKVCIHNY